MFLRKIDLERGNIVICVGLFGHCGDEEVWYGMDEGTLGKTNVGVKKYVHNVLRERMIMENYLEIGVWKIAAMQKQVQKK